eukprot:TRINITY_DN1407_c0_g1_i1.p1 TRINITY_DN1407_c0_g1~~TRINITY_DN1407_c0_g1_i1.p1  ORF type:complete len:224 (-),score=31.13 TRINITY_DN1407_c0_g1_i1:692-1363(-)
MALPFGKLVSAAKRGDPVESNSQRETDAWRTDLPWAAQMKVIRGASSSPARREVLEPDEFTRASSVTSGRSRWAWQEATALDQASTSTVSTTINRQDSRLLCISDSESEAEAGAEPKVVLVEQAMPEMYPTCGLFSYSIDGRASAAPAPVPAHVPSYWSVFPACMSAPECGSICWSERLVGEKNGKHAYVHTKHVALADFQEDECLDPEELPGNYSRQHSWHL